MVNDETHECPAKGCTKQIEYTRMACRDHWYRVSRATRDLIWDLYKNGPIDRYLKVRERAIEEMNRAA